MAKGFESHAPKKVDQNLGKRKFEATNVSSKKAKSATESVGSVKKGGSGESGPRYFNCGQRGHLSSARDNFQNEGHRKSMSHELSVEERKKEHAKKLERAAGGARSRDYLMSNEEARRSNEVVSGTFVVNSNPAELLFDRGANLSFVSPQFVNKHDRTLVKLRNPVAVKITDGKTVLGFDVCKNCDIVFGNENFKIDLIPMTLDEFDVFVGMD
ncbi:uncharacterized protein [Rutidosis leptorrhynchoides]|uniref:uncharacterized protein n=1 Tax=Rutidosis leptorrhynchoides TaxID=125765 RepID=UPI003A99B249